MGRLISGVNDLKTKFPEIAAQFHPVKNGTLTPSQIASTSHEKVWWICDKGHEYEAIVSNKSQGHGCPVCAGKIVLPGFNDLASDNPTLIAEWHPTKNGKLTPQQVTANSTKKVWWQCSEGHEWQASPNHRNYGKHNCPYCSNQKILMGFNDMTTTHPELAKEWHPTLNGELLPTMIGAGSHKKVWWQCSEGHEWQAIIQSRKLGYGCPVCARIKRKKENERK